LAKSHLEALYRIQVILRELRRGVYPNYRYLAALVERDRKTVQRDFETLRYQFNAPIAYSARERGFYLTEPRWKLEL